MSSVLNINSSSTDKKLPRRSSGRIKSKAAGIPLMSLEEANTPRKVRERKHVERYEPEQEIPTQKKPIYHEGTGTPLKDIPRVASKLQARKNKDYILYTLHRFLFGRTEGKPNVKEDLESFKGFTFQTLEEEDMYWNKLEKWTVETCKSVCDVLDLPFPNNKNDLYRFIMEFLKNPEPRDATDIQEECNIQISPFSYFVRQKRGELIRDNPDKSLEEIQKELDALWESLSNEEKSIYQSHNPNETPNTKKRKYTRRGDKKPITTAGQTSPAKRGRKPKSAHESTVSGQKKRGPKSQETVEKSGEEDNARVQTKVASSEPSQEEKEGNAEDGRILNSSTLEDDAVLTLNKRQESSD